MTVQSTYFERKSSWIFLILVSACVGLGFIVFSTRAAHILVAGLGQAVNSFDYRIVSFLNSFAGRSWTLDTGLYLIDSSPLFTAPILMAFWWSWFKQGQDETQHREFLIQGIINSFLAPSFARILATTLPFRERPLHNLLLHFQLPYNMDPHRLIGWSSFPSDHAALWFTLATTIFFVSRRLGIFLFVYVFSTLCLARIYLGIHYPTDILVGALIGVGVVYFSKVSAVRVTLTRQQLRWVHSAPSSFYALLFIITQQQSEGFSSLHELEQFLRSVVTAVIKLV
jgi:undecaprenyl-diphosphatase